MSSIAYMSDVSMIEFHRLHGHDEINFWRLSTRQFSDFSTNDFLFFLVKTNRKERGIVGYGKLHHSENLSVRKMWNKYEQLNGYASYQELYDAIARANKQDLFPGKCNCLYLKGVTFFEAPLYLSEFDFDLSSNLESFTYIDQNQDTTSRILDAAKSIGTDLWSQTTSGLLPINFDQEILIHKLANFVSEFGMFATKKHASLMNSLNRDNQSLFPLASNKNILYECHHDRVTLYLPLLKATKKDALGIYGLIHAITDHFREYQEVMSFALVVKDESSELEDIFRSLNVRIITPPGS